MQSKAKLNNVVQCEWKKRNRSKLWRKCTKKKQAMKKASTDRDHLVLVVLKCWCWCRKRWKYLLCHGYWTGRLAICFFFLSFWRSNCVCTKTDRQYREFQLQWNLWNVENVLARTVYPERTFNFLFLFVYQLSTSAIYWIIKCVINIFSLFDDKLAVKCLPHRNS